MRLENEIQLRDEQICPNEQVLRSVLQDAYQAYVQLLDKYDQLAMTYEWRYYHDGKAWLCKVQYKKRTIVWMSAWPGSIKATIYFPEKYLDDLYALDISQELKDSIRSTPQTGRSQPCIFVISDTSSFDDLDQVIRLKIVCR